MPADGHFTPAMQVNSEHQLWSQWTFGIEADLDKVPSFEEVLTNARAYFTKLFGHAGRIRVEQPDFLTFRIFVQVEGKPANDPDFRTHVKRQFIENFIFKGFGFCAKLVEFDVKILAGDRQDGTPRDQLIVVPTIHF